MECEGILQHEPDCAAIIAIMGDLESRTEERMLPAPVQALEPQMAVQNEDAAPSGMRTIAFSQTSSESPGAEKNDFRAHQNGGALGGPNARSGLIRSSESSQNGKTPGGDGIKLNFGGSSSSATPNLIETAATSGGRSGRAPRVDLGDDGNSAFAAFLSNNGLASGPLVQSVLKKLKAQGAVLDRPADSLLLNVSRESGVELDFLLANLVELTKMDFVPLNYYDIERDIVRMFPEDLTVGRLVLPFDMLSRTLLVAITNPFDASAREYAQQSVEYSIHWYLAPPDAIQNKVAHAYGMRPPNS